MIATGDKVRHPKMPDWGIGKVLEVTSDGKARIFFIHAGDKTILLSHIDFEKIEGEEAAHLILDNPSFFERATVKGHKRLPSSVYWAGLGVWGIRITPFSQDEYHRRIDETYRAEKVGSQAYQELRQRHRSYICLLGSALCLAGVPGPVADGDN